MSSITKWIREFTGGPPAPPNQIWGTLFINDIPAPLGIKIQAVIPDIPKSGDNFCRGEAIIVEGGTYNFNLKIPPEGLDSSEIGSVVTFWVGGVLQCVETHKIVEMGCVDKMDLHATGVVPEPEPEPIPTPVPTPTPIPVSLINIDDVLKMLSIFSKDFHITITLESKI